MSKPTNESISKTLIKVIKKLLKWLPNMFSLSTGHKAEIVTIFTLNQSVKP